MNRAHRGGGAGAGGAQGSPEPSTTNSSSSSLQRRRMSSNGSGGGGGGGGCVGGGVGGAPVGAGTGGGGVIRNLLSRPRPAKVVRSKEAISSHNVETARSKKPDRKKLSTAFSKLLRKDTTSSSRESPRRSAERVHDAQKPSGALPPAAPPIVVGTPKTAVTSSGAGPAPALPPRPSLRKLPSPRPLGVSVSPPAHSPGAQSRGAKGGRQVRVGTPSASRQPKPPSNTPATASDHPPTPAAKQQKSENQSERMKRKPAEPQKPQKPAKPEQKPAEQQQQLQKQPKPSDHPNPVAGAGSGQHRPAKAKKPTPPKAHKGAAAAAPGLTDSHTTDGESPRKQRRLHSTQDLSNRSVDAQEPKPAPKSPKVERAPPLAEPDKEQNKEKEQLRGKHAPAYLEAGTLIINRLRVARLLGSGGFGQVFKAYDTLNGNREVAIKVMPRDSEAARMILEQQVLNQLRGTPHAPSLVASGTYGANLMFIAMEMLGRNLSDLRHRRPNDRFEPGTVMYVGVEMVEALRALHSIGFLHRDVKPSNMCVGKARSSANSSPRNAGAAGGAGGAKKAAAHSVDCTQADCSQQALHTGVERSGSSAERTCAATAAAGGTSSTGSSDALGAHTVTCTDTEPTSTGSGAVTTGTKASSTTTTSTGTAGTTTNGTGTTGTGTTGTGTTGTTGTLTTGAVTTVTGTTGTGTTGTGTTGTGNTGTGTTGTIITGTGTTGAGTTGTGTAGARSKPRTPPQTTQHAQQQAQHQQPRAQQPQSASKPAENKQKQPQPTSTTEQQAQDRDQAEQLKARRVYLLDYGMTRRFRQSGGVRRKERPYAGFRGTKRYVSLTVHERREQGPCDDLWSLVYTLVELGEGALPWRDLEDDDDVAEKKRNTPLREMLMHLPTEFADLLPLLEPLTYESTPDYAGLQAALRRASQGRGPLPGPAAEQPAPEWEPDAQVSSLEEEARSLVQEPGA